MENCCLRNSCGISAEEWDVTFVPQFLIFFLTCIHGCYSSSASPKQLFLHDRLSFSALRKQIYKSTSNQQPGWDITQIRKLPIASCAIVICKRSHQLLHWHEEWDIQKHLADMLFIINSFHTAVHNGNVRKNKTSVLQDVGLLLAVYHLTWTVSQRQKCVSASSSQDVVGSDFKNNA